MSSNIVYHPNLYLGEGITTAKLDKIKKRLEKKPLFCDVYLLMISRNPSDQLEIMAAKQLAQKYYSAHPVQVVGVAQDHSGAVALVEQIVQECLESRGDCALKEYLLC